MSYRALYRTYRPSTFNEVAGQKAIVQTIKNALKESKIAHAYLFCGPRGTGKTTMARLLAKALNCSEGFSCQCNKCENCLAINSGTHPDVIELDAASNRGIDDIRDLINKVKYAPVMGRYKVYIIDEVHMMTNEAFNALLKTLEEPPSNVVFILATTEPYKLMPTILSRVQRYDFDKVSDREILKRVEEILLKENIEFEEDALKEIISIADGGVRDTLSMIDQAIVYSDMHITKQSVEELFSLTSKQDKLSLFLALQNKDVVKLNAIIDNFASRGTDLKKLTSDLLYCLKDLLIYRISKDASLLKYLTLEDCQLLTITPSQINKLIDSFIELINQYKYVSNIASLFEISLLKMIFIFNEEPIKNYEISAKNIEPLSNKENSNALIVNSIDFSNIDDIADDGEKISFSIDDLLNIMVQAKKEYKVSLMSKKETLNQLLSIPHLSKYIMALKSSKPMIVALECVIYVSDFTDAINKINIKKNQKVFDKIHQCLTSHSMKIIALSNEDYQNAIEKFKNLSQIGKLPSPHAIDIDTKYQEQDSLTKKLSDELNK